MNQEEIRIRSFRASTEVVCALVRQGYGIKKGEEKLQVKHGFFPVEA